MIWMRDFKGARFRQEEEDVSHLLLKLWPPSCAGRTKVDLHLRVPTRAQAMRRRRIGVCDGGGESEMVGESVGGE